MDRSRFAAGPGLFPLTVLALLLGTLMALGPSSSARAQPVKEGRSAEIVVRASQGPALWVVSKGQAELVILGAVEPTPQNTTWNARRLQEALQGARSLLLSPGSTPGLAWAEDFPQWERYLLEQPDGRSLGQEIGAASMSRLSQLAIAARQPLSRYAVYRPGPAGMILLQDSWQARQLTASAVDDAVVALARRQHVRVVKVDEGGSLPLIDAMPSMSKAQHLACVAQSMDRFDWEGAKADAIFEAWADGRVAALREVYRPLQLCVDSIPGGARRRARAKAIWIQALGDALERPGRTVAVMDVADLLGPSDVLAALEAQGATVTAPPDEPAGSQSELASLHLGPGSASDPVQAYAPTLRELDAGHPALLLQARVPTGVAAQPASVVDLAGGDIVCVQEQGTETLLTHETCHTRYQWDQLERHRDMSQADELRHGKMPLPDDY